jgi:ppGpp synthetase/RelA/SpoT-type nucleotidyltranferase
MSDAPTSRDETDAADPAPAAIEAYAMAHADLVVAGAEALALVTNLLDDAGINYLTVSGRTKSIASFAEKAVRTVDGVRLYADPLREIGDQLGVRVITYVRDDVDAVADLLADQVVVRDDRDLGRETASEGRFGYASRHLQITLDAARENHPAYARLSGRNIQVQIRTVLQHAWAEFEHDIRYKGTVPSEHAHDFDRRFTLAAGLLELADQEFTTIRSRLRGPVSRTEQPDQTEHAGHAAHDGRAATADPRLEPRELAAFLAGQYDDAGWSRSDHYAWVSGLLLELGITSLVELGEVLRAVDDDAIRDRMGYRYPPGAVRRLDDALLATYGERYVGLHGNAHRVAALRTRLDRLSDGDP